MNRKGWILLAKENKIHKVVIPKGKILLILSFFIDRYCSIKPKADFTPFFGREGEGLNFQDSRIRGIVLCRNKIPNLPEKITITVNDDEIEIPYPISLICINSIGELRKFLYIDLRGNPKYCLQSMLLPTQSIPEISLNLLPQDIIPQNQIQQIVQQPNQIRRISEPQVPFEPSELKKEIDIDYLLFDRKKYVKSTPVRIKFSNNDAGEFQKNSINLLGK